jgi:hypothetical protein
MGLGNSPPPRPIAYSIKQKVNKMNTKDKSGFHFRSFIANLECEHKHLKKEEAMQCAASRIANGALKYYIGEDQPLIVPQKELHKYVSRYLNSGKRVIANA